MLKSVQHPENFLYNIDYMFTKTIMEFLTLTNI